MRQVKFNDLNLLHNDIYHEMIYAVESTIKKNDYIGGNAIKEFEKNFAEFCNAKYAAGVSNGTSAIMLALLAIGIQPQDEIIVPAQSFIATIEPIITLGAKPIFIDIDKETHCIDTKKIEQNITDKTKAIIPVHLYGHACDMDEIISLAKKYNLKVIEDASQAHGAKYKNKVIGSIGDIATFSFYPGKNLGAIGDAGGITSNNKNYIEYIKAISNHGRSEGKKYDHDFIGYNCRMDTIQAKILNIKLKHIENWNQKRVEIANLYHTLLEGVVETLSPPNYSQSVYHIFIIMVKNRDEVQRKLKEVGISTGIHYPKPQHQYQPITDIYGDLTGKCPIAEQCAKKILSIPVDPKMEEKEVRYVVKSLKEIIK